MFERFTSHARRAVVLAQNQAKILNHPYIGTEHILLGLLDEGEGVAAKALRAMDISLEVARCQIEKQIGRGGTPQSGRAPFTPRAKRAFEFTLREALMLGHDRIDTEHILLGLLREMGTIGGQGVAAAAFAELGVNTVHLREKCLSLLNSKDDHSMSSQTALELPGEIPTELERRQLRDELFNINTVLLPEARAAVDQLKDRCESITRRLSVLEKK